MPNLKEAYQTIVDWSQGRCWWGRGLLLVLFIYIGIRHLSDPIYTSIFKALNLVIHEAGHLILGLSQSQFLEITGGTVFQLLIPIVAAFMFLQQEDYFALIFCGVWLSTNFYDVATYVADAREQILPLVSIGGGGTVIHDWNYILSRLNLLSWDTTIAAIIRLFAFISMWGSISIGVWIIWIMIKVNRNHNQNIPPF